MKRIGLLLAGDGPELFRDLLAPLGIVLRRYDIDQGRFPESLDDCDGWLGSPGRMRAHARIAWIRDVEQLHRDLIAQERPYVGIGFGHLLLAQALGGRVDRNEDDAAVGVHDYELVDAQPWMGPSPPSVFSLMASHEDQVTVPPAEARVIARADDCPVAGLAVGERAWTLQGHPELVPAPADGHTDRLTVGRWIADFFDSVSS